MRVAILLALLPVVGHAEGARQTFDCRATLFCDAAGTCEPADDPLPTFTLSPLDVGDHGEGEYTITYGPIEAQATIPADAPLILWTDPNGALNTLTVTGQASPTTATMLFQVVLPGLSSAAIRFLACEVVQ